MLESGRLPRGWPRRHPPLAKKPEDRFQTASELAQSLALAAEGEAMAANAASAATAADALPERDTNRIVVTTGSNEPPRSTTNEDYDESTIVQPGRGAGEAGYQTRTVSPEPPPSPESFNPWRILVPALAGLLVVCGVIYALTRNSAQPASNQQNGPLIMIPAARMCNRTIANGTCEQNLIQIA